MKRYRIVYAEYLNISNDKEVIVTANSKEEAYDKAVYEVLESIPYSAYVYSYITKDGKEHRLANSFHGKRY